MKITGAKFTLSSSELDFLKSSPSNCTNLLDPSTVTFIHVMFLKGGLLTDHSSISVNSLFRFKISEDKSAPQVNNVY